MGAAGRRVLGIDLGDARIGVALSDELGITAQPAGYIKRESNKDALHKLLALVEQHGAGTVVIGLPLHMSGEAGERAQQAERLADRLRVAAPDIDVVLWDERLTSIEAERAMTATNVRRGKRRQLVDSLAASIILGSYMSRFWCRRDWRLPLR